MSNDLRLGMVSPRISQPPRGESGMHHTGTLPDLHIFAAGLALYIVAEILIGQKENCLLLRNRIDHLNGIARRAQNIALGLHFDRCVDVADDRVIRVPLPVNSDWL